MFTTLHEKDLILPHRVSYRMRWLERGPAYTAVPKMRYIHTLAQCSVSSMLTSHSSSKIPGVVRQHPHGNQ